MLLRCTDLCVRRSTMPTRRIEGPRKVQVQVSAHLQRDIHFSTIKLGHQSGRGRWEQYGCGPVRGSGEVSPCRVSEEVRLVGYLSGRNMRWWAVTFIKASRVWRREQLTWTALNSLVTIVATPRKKVGLLAPSIWCPYPLTSTNVPFCADISWLMPDGYMSWTCGRNTAEAFLIASPTVTCCAVRSSKSLGRVRG